MTTQTLLSDKVKFPKLKSYTGLEETLNIQKNNDDDDNNDNNNILIYLANRASFYVVYVHGNVILG